MRLANLQKIADYFKVPVEFFDKDSTDDIDLFTGAKLTDHARALISIYNKLDPVSQSKLLVYASDLAKNN